MNELENLNKLWIHVPVELLATFISQITGLDLDWADVKTEKTKKAQRQKAQVILATLAFDVRLELEEWAEKIVLLSDGPGQDVLEGFYPALFTDAERYEVKALANPYWRALWFYEKAQDMFKEALDAREADVFRQSQSCYSGYQVPCHLAVLQGDDGAMQSFRDQVATHFTCQPDAVAIDLFTRLRPDTDTGEDGVLYQISIHHNRLPESMDYVEACERVTRDVIRADTSFITYEPGNGYLEVLSRHSSGREVLARLVADVLLKSPVTGDKIPLKQYHYQHLAAPQLFDLAGENIASVKVVQLGYEVNHRELMFKIPGNDPESLYAAARSVIHAEFDFRHHTLTYARINVRLKKTASERARSVHIVLRQDHKCNVKTKREKDRALCDRLLVKWGLIKTVGHDALDAIAA